MLDANQKAALVAQKTELVDLLTIDVYALIAATFEDISLRSGSRTPSCRLDDAIHDAALAGDSAAPTP